MGQVIDQVALHSVEHLEKVLAVDGGLTGFLALFVGGFEQVLADMSRVGEGLDIAVVRDRDGGHAPLIGPLDQVLALGNPVHIAHLCVAVELDPFDGRIIHPL